jgi:hypothetical protein
MKKSMGKKHEKKESRKEMMMEYGKEYAIKKISKMMKSKKAKK